MANFIFFPDDNNDNYVKTYNFSHRMYQLQQAHSDVFTSQLVYNVGFSNFADSYLGLDFSSNTINKKIWHNSTVPIHQRPWYSNTWVSIYEPLCTGCTMISVFSLSKFLY